MKKLATAFAACMLAGLVSAQVESQNIVGYDTTTLPKNAFTAMGAQFQMVGGGVTETNLFITNLVSVTNSKAGSSASTTVDQIQVWNGSAWTVYFNKTGVGFVKNSTDTVPTSDTISIGTAYFFRKANATAGGDATAVGQVFQGTNVTINLPKNAFTFVAYPWPVDYAISNFVSAISNPKAGASASTTVDQIQVWTGSAWTVYFNKTSVGYVKSASDTSPTTDVVPVGAGCFVRKANATSGGTLTLTRPAGL